MRKHVEANFESSRLEEKCIEHTVDMRCAEIEALIGEEFRVGEKSLLNGNREKETNIGVW